MKSIINPEKTTYFICRDENETITAYGSVETHQTMNTGQPTVQTYLEKSEWENELLKGGIELDNQQELSQDWFPDAEI